MCLPLLNVESPESKSTVLLRSEGKFVSAIIIGVRLSLARQLTTLGESTDNLCRHLRTIVYL